MLIGVAGPPCAGKSALVAYLAQRHGFRPLRLRTASQPAGDSVNGQPPASERLLTTDEVLDRVTPQWREHFVVYPIDDMDTLNRLRVRPFFLLVAVDAPVLTRYRRHQAKFAADALPLTEFLAADDEACYEPVDWAAGDAAEALPPEPSLQKLALADEGVTAADALPATGSAPGRVRAVMAAADVIVTNATEGMAALAAQLDALNLLDMERVRPSWDHYFMVMANLAARRSNCMKRRVGAVLVRDFRVISTGYNGTARRTTNCNEGGCPRCNANTRRGHALDQCLCLHAEENALIEAGRERAEGATLYCSACPCLSCAKKIAQSGLKAVVYAEEYAMGHLTAALLSEAGVTLRRLSQGPPSSLPLTRPAHSFDDSFLGAPSAS